MLLPEICDRYLTCSQANGIHGAEAFAERSRVLRAFVAHCPLDHAEAKPYHLSDWIESNPRWRSTSTRKAKANMVNAMLNWAVDGGRIDRNPFKRVNYEEAEPRPCMPDDVLAAILDRGNRLWCEAVQFLRMTGCRLSDLCRLCWEGVDMEKGVAIVYVWRKRKTKKKTKVFALLVPTVELLRKIKSRLLVAAGPVFVNNRGKPWTRRTLGQQLDRIKEKLGITAPFTLHGIRHQVGTLAIRNGAPPKAVSMLLNHQSTAITERYYVHLDGDLDFMRKAALAAQNATP